MRENIADPDFNPLLTPEEVAADPCHWGEARPNRLMVYQQHRYRYDRWGNCIEKKSGAHEVRKFVWDAEHQLTRAHITRVERGQLVTEHWGYDYDPFGRRIAKYRLSAAADNPIASQSGAKACGSSSGAKISETATASVYATHQRTQSKRALRQRDRARHQPDSIHFGWDGNRLLRESCAGRQTIYLYESDSFVPLALVRNDSMPDSGEQSSIAPSEQRRVSGLAGHTQDTPATARPVQPLPDVMTTHQSAGREPEGDDLAGLPLEIRQLKDSQPAHWALAEKRRQKLQQRLNAQLGVPAEIVPPRPVAEIFYVHTDHLGTPRELTDADGHLVWTATYKAWGAATVTNPARRHIHAVDNALVESWEEQVQPVVQNLRFQGQYFDAETGLHYNRFRYYDPDVSRFISQDPIGFFGGHNYYQYAANPISWIDPLGLSGYTVESNTATPDMLARGVHVNVRGPGLPPRNGGHVTLVPVLDGQTIYLQPADSATRELGSSQWTKVCKCIKSYLDEAKNVERLANTAQGGIDFHQGKKRALEFAQVRDILRKHLLSGTNPVGSQ